MSVALLSNFVAWATDEAVPPATALARLAVAIGEVTTADRRSLDRIRDVMGVESDLSFAVPWSIPAQLTSADLLGRAHEALLSADHRHRNGVHYTPGDVAAGIVSAAMGSRTRSEAPTVCDPSVGGGVFLLAAAQHLEARGMPRASIVEHLLWGVDIDPVAAAVTATALSLWSAETDRWPRSTHVAVADTLRAGRSAWSDAPERGFDVVVGNPPFQSQLGTSTARRSEELDELRARFGSTMFRYADTAALFLLESCRWVADGGRVTLVLPMSVLVANDAAPLRRAVLDLGMLESIWVAGEAVFAAGVRVCAPTIAVGPGDGGSVGRTRGRSFTPAAPHAVTRSTLRDEPTWGTLIADLFGAPTVVMPAAPTLASFCSATAGFRDQFYGIQPFVREASAAQRAASASATTMAPLVTSGLIEPVRSAWGTRPTRFAGTSYLAPVVDLAALGAADPKLMGWTRDRLVPKLVVATQTRVLELVVDEQGVMFPSVPTIAVTCPPDRLWEAAAVVMAPAVTAWAMGRHAGAALSTDALKVSAKQLLEAPLPADRDCWIQACDPLRRAAAATNERMWREALGDFGSLMGKAYGSDDEVLEWWIGRLPTWRA